MTLWRLWARQYFMQSNHLLFLRCSIHLHCKVDLMENLLGTWFYDTDDSRLSLNHLLLRLMVHYHHLLLGGRCSNMVFHSWTNTKRAVSNSLSLHLHISTRQQLMQWKSDLFVPHLCWLRSPCTEQSGSSLCRVWVPLGVSWGHQTLWKTDHTGYSDMAAHLKVNRNKEVVQST